MPFTLNRVWRQMSDEMRLAASQTYWSKSTKGQQQFVIAALAKSKNLREVMVRKSPLERQIIWTANCMVLPEVIVNDLLREFLLGAHRPVIIRFLDLLAIPHAEGMIEDSFDMETLAADKIQEAARTLMAGEDAAAAELYMKYLVVQGEPWEVIEETLPASE